MSVELAAGWVLSRFQPVSVVPTIQWRPQGITNSTDVSVRTISPVSSWIRSRGTTRWMPLDARTWNLPRSPARCCTSSVHTPVALTTSRACTASSSPVCSSRTHTPVTRSPSRRKPIAVAFDASAAPNLAAVRATITVWRASSTWASWYWIAPTSASGFSAGATRNAPRRVRWRWRGRPSCPPSESYSTIPAPMYARCQCSVRGSRNGTGWTRCGASTFSSRPRSRSASRTRLSSPCSR